MLDNAEPLMGRAWHVVAASSDIGSEPRETWLLGRRWLLSRGLTRLEARDESGAGPHDVVERHGLVWLAPDSPLAPFPELLEPADPAFATAVLTRVTKVSAGVLTDNFLDVSHFSYLHPATFGRLAPVTTENCTVARSGWQLELRHATDLHEGGPAAPTWRIATYTVRAPYVAHLSLHFPATDSLSAATMTCQPETHDRTTVRVLVSWPADDPRGLEEQVAFSAAVLAEDLAILELMADPRLPLSLRAELHTKADRASVEYRRLLTDQLRATRGLVAA